MIPVSILDLAPITAGSDAAQSFRNTVELAQTAERSGYHRYWLAEHHNMPGIASAATAVLIGHVAGATQRIRVGAGGIMLPNHSPLQVAEQFGTLATLYPERIDLGLGRAPGTDQPTARALRRYFASAKEYPQNVAELLQYFQSATAEQQVRAIPGAGTQLLPWLLGSSLFSAGMAAHMGLPYSFASHFAPDALSQALDTYRREFQPSAQLQQPRAMMGLNVIAADSDAEARRLFTTQQQMFVNLRRGHAGQVPPPVDNIDDFCHPMERQGVDQALACSVVGSRDSVRAGIEAFVERYPADELIITAHVYDHTARLRSFEIVADVLGLN